MKVKTWEREERERETDRDRDRQRHTESEWELFGFSNKKKNCWNITTTLLTFLVETKLPYRAQRF